MTTFTRSTLSALRTLASGRAATCLVALLALVLGGCGGSTVDTAYGSGGITITSVVPSTFTGVGTGGVGGATAGTPFTIYGTNFQTLAGTTARVIMRATGGATPFGGESSLELVGTVTSPTTITGIAPPVALCGVGSVPVTLEVVLESAVTSGPVALGLSFASPQVASIAPVAQSSYNPGSFTITGSYLPPVGSSVQVRFSGGATGSWSGSDSAVVAGTVATATTITGTAPSNSNTIDFLATVLVEFPDGSCSASSLTTAYLGPVVTGITPSAVTTNSPTGFTITGGSNLPPNGAAVTVRFSGGTAGTWSGANVADVAGTVTAGTTITGTTPTNTSTASFPADVTVLYGAALVPGQQTLQITYNPPVITIDTQPTAQTAVGGAATFTVAASVAPSGTPTYQWQKQESGAGPWSNVATGGTAATLSLTGLTPGDDDGDLYRVVVSAPGAVAVTSAEVLLTVPSVDWSQMGEDLDGEAFADNSGGAVSLSADGTTIAIGAPYNDGSFTSDDGHVRVFDWNGTSWIQRGADILGEASDDWSGFSVSLSADGNTVAIGAPQNGANSEGHVRVYDWDAGTGTWVQRGADLDGVALGDAAGSAVSLAPDGNTVAFTAPGRDAGVSNVGSTSVYDWDGTAWVQRGSEILGESLSDFSGNSLSLSADANTVAIGASLNDGIYGPDDGHVRVYDWDGTAWIQRGADLDGVGATDSFGSSVSLSADGNSLAVGAIAANGMGSDRGAAYVYDWDGSAWVLRGLSIDGAADNDNFGCGVSLSADGNSLAVSAPGADVGGLTDAGLLQVFDWDGTAWVQRGSDMDGEGDFNYSGGRFNGFTSNFDGGAVSLSAYGGRVAAGAMFNDGVNGADSGHVRVYESAPPSAFTQRGSTVEGEEFEGQGGVVAVNAYGTRMAIGSPYTDGTGNERGEVRVYEWDMTAGNWVQVGSTLSGDDDFDQFGYSVALSDDGNVLAVGARFGDDGSLDTGEVRVYDWDPTANAGAGDWVLRGTVISSLLAGDLGGTSVSLSADGNTVAFGAPGNDDAGTDAGAAFVFDWDGTAWIARGSAITGEDAGDNAGGSVSLSADGNTLVVGARFNDDAGTNAGSVRVYDWDAGAGTWVLRGAEVDGQAAGDQFGSSVSLSADGNTMVVGAPFNDDSGTNSGQVRVYDWDPTANGGAGAWVQRGSQIDGAAAGDQFGGSVSISDDGNTLAVGARLNDDGGTDAGAVELYRWDPSANGGAGAWVRLDTLTGAAAGDQFGGSVSLSGSGSLVGVGASTADGNAGADTGTVTAYSALPGGGSTATGTIGGASGGGGGGGSNPPGQAPQNFGATAGTNAGEILIDFDAINSSATVSRYEYSTDGGLTWALFPDPAQQPAQDIVVTVDAYGNPLESGTSYDVCVRVISSFGAVRNNSTIAVTAP
ncbi:MAG: beta strand repeat-containing protein [Planctomycetia bacterium]